MNPVKNTFTCLKHAGQFVQLWAAGSSLSGLVLENIFLPHQAL